MHRTVTTKAENFMARVGITATKSIAERRPYMIVQFLKIVSSDDDDDDVR